MNTTPRWLIALERKLGWIAIPNIAILFVTLQAIGFLFVMMDPIWITRLAFFPEMVRAGEYWRLVTFLSLPLSLSPLWVIFTLWFLYFILNQIEGEWGAFKTTFYVLVSVLLTLAFGFAFNYPVTSVSDFESTLFLAAAALYPDMEVQLFLILPVKMKWLAWLTLAFAGYRFVGADLLGKVFMLAIYSNYLLFFGPAQIQAFRQMLRRRRYKRNSRL